MATQTKKLGTVPVYRGDYASGTTYYKHNIVAHNGSAFVCTADSATTAPSVLDEDAQTLTPNTGWSFLADSSGALFAQALADANSDALAILARDFAQYEEATPLTLSSGTSGKYVDATGAVKSNSSYSVSAQVTLEKGNIYLVKPSTALITGVALCAEYTTEEKNVVIDYTYTYDDDGKALTATADYDTSLVYTYTYDTDGTLISITDKSGVAVSALPGYRAVSAGSYIPLFKNLSTTAPKSGYYAVLCNETCKAVFSLPTADITSSVTVASYGIFRSIINNKEDKAVVKKLQEEVAQLKAENSMFAQSSFADVVYDSAQESDPAADGEYGDDDPSDNFDFLMVDHTAAVSDNGGAPYYVLERNNTFRYKGGGYAPVVSITDDEMSACTDTTYSRSVYAGGTLVKTFAEGEAYDAEAVVEAIKAAYEAGTAAYTDAITMTSNSVSGQHAVMPWETASQDMSLYIGNTKSVWLIDHQEGKSGKYHTAVLRRNTVIDGIDPSDFELKPTGLTPSRVFTVTNSDSKVVTRCHFTTREGMTNCAGEAGNGGFCTAFKGGGTYPRTSDLQQVKLMGWARNNNSDSASPLPHAEGGYHALNTLVCALEVEHKTKYLHAASFFGSGISCNDTCNSEATWKANGGVAYKASSDTAYTYCTWSATPKIYNASGATIASASSIVNYERAKERTMESQTAMSWAAEMGIAPSTEFTTPYGGSYTYVNADGSASVPSPLMAVRLYKEMDFDIEAYNASAEATTYNVKAMLRVSLFNGFQMTGDVWAYCGGGAEAVAEVTASEQLVSGGAVGLIPVKMYVEPDQSKWLNVSDFNKDSLGTFDFEASYPLMAEDVNLQGWSKDRHALTPLQASTGGGTSTYMCFYQYMSNYFNTTTLNRRTRLALRFFGGANNGNCAPRYLNAFNAVSNTGRIFGGLAQVFLGAAAAQPQ